MKYIAHKTNEPESAEQRIIDHLRGTAKRCSKFAEGLELSEYAYAVAMLHDIGKYSEKFQLRISGANVTVDHSTAGAQIAFVNGLPMAMFCIAGHHGGIPNLGSNADTADEGTIMGRIKKTLEDFSVWRTEQPELDLKSLCEPKTRSNLDFTFLTRMLFSCLVDADYLDTEKFMCSGKSDHKPGDSMELLLQRLNSCISHWNNPQGKLNILRNKMLCESVEAGKKEKSKLFTMTVPTGGGKTVSSLAFALNYAVKNNKKHIIYVIPYTSIIEQNAEVFRNILGENNVLEYHSNIDIPSKNKENTKLLLASENWDVPVVVTTAVQFFESLFSNKPGRCRKLHNIADSVVIFDEAQMLPLEYIYPCICAIWQLTEICNTATVLCTATQPNLGRFFAKVADNEKGINVREICGSADGCIEDFRRVSFSYDGKLDDDVLSSRLCSEEQVLCIVNKKLHAQRIYNLLGSESGNFHLSTYMYPLHRKRTINEIKGRLKTGERCRVVSTSLIEAGVDIDFPAVYRAMSGLDSILQAGGRCNRENTRTADESIVHIFDTDEFVSYQEINIVVAREVIKKFGNKIYLNEAVKMYFEKLYYYLDSEKNYSQFDKKQIISALEDFKFETAARDFRLIDNINVTLYIPTAENEADINALRNRFYSKDLFRRLQSFSVNLYEYELKKLDSVSAVEIIEQSFGILTKSELYDDNIGLIIPDSNLGCGIFID